MLSFVKFLVADAAAAPKSGGLGDLLIPMLLMGVVFYMLILRPQQAQQKALQKRISELQKGDQVVTSAGIHGLVHNIKERTVVLKVAEATMIEFEKSSVANVIKKDSAVAVESK